MAFKFRSVLLAHEETDSLFNLEADVKYLVNGERMTFKYMLGSKIFVFKGLLHIHEFKLDQIDSIEYTEQKQW